MILLFCISLIRVELVVNERKIGTIIHVEKGGGVIMLYTICLHSNPFISL